MNYSALRSIVMQITHKKINFDLIKVKQNQRAKEEDLKYFKSSFERIFFDEKSRR